MPKPLKKSRPWKHAIRVFLEGGLVFAVVYIAASYATGAHLDAYPSLNPREKILHCSAEAVLLGMPVFGVITTLICRMENGVHDRLAGLSLPILYGASLFVGGVIGLVVGFLFSLTSGVGLVMASSFPVPAACGGAASMLLENGRRIHPKTVFRIFEWALIAVVCGGAVWLKGT